MRQHPKSVGRSFFVVLAIGAGCQPAGVDQGTVPTLTTWGALELCLNEFVADNASGWQDETGAFSDWVELHNPGGQEVALDGWYLTDDADDPWAHRLGGLSIAPGGFLVLFGDGMPELGPTHLSFGLSRDGEALGLFREDGVGELLVFDAVAQDYAWARTPDCCTDVESCTTIRWHGTPGASNAD